MAALDFSNRDPKDPNGIYSLDTARALDAWVKDKDWSTVYYDAAEARKAGANNKIRVATAITNDGRKFDVALNQQGQPIAEMGDPTGQDDDRARAWRQDNPTTNTGVTGSNPRVPPGSIPRIEGTPLGDGTFDNSQPIRAWHTPDGQVVYEPLSPSDSDYQQWQRNKNGGKTDAEVERDRKDAEAKADADKKAKDTQVADVSYTGTGRNRVKITTYQSGRKEQVAAPTDATPIKTEYDPKTGQKRVTYDDGTTTTEDQKPNAADLGGPIPAAAPRYTPNYDQPDLGLTDYGQQLLAAVRSGVLTNAQARQLQENAGGLATQTASHGTTLRSQAATTRNQDITQRAQDLGEVQSRRQEADTSFLNAWNAIGEGARYLGTGGGDIAAAAFNDFLAQQEARTRRLGGYDAIPQVPAGGMQGISPAIAATTTTTMLPTPNTPGQIPPNVLGVGAIGNQPAPGAAPAPMPAMPDAQAAAREAAIQSATASRSSAGPTPSPAMPTLPPGAQGPDPSINPATGDATSVWYAPTEVAQPGDPGYVDRAPVFMPRGGVPYTGYPDVQMGPPPAYLRSASQPQPWSPDPVVADLRRQGFSDDEINDALALHHQTYAA